MAKIKVELGRAKLIDTHGMYHLVTKGYELEQAGYDVLHFYDYNTEEGRQYQVYHVFFKTEEEAAIFKLTHL